MRTRRPLLAAALAPALALLLWAAPAEAELPAQARPELPAETRAQARAQAPPPAAGGTEAADEACDPRVRQALADSAQAGVEAELAIIRDPDQGIRNPDSLFDFSCITNLFDYGSFDILFDPAGALDDILDLARRRICQTARDAYRRYLGRALDPAVYTAPLPRLPGLDVDRSRRNVFDDTGADDAARFRDAIGGAR